MAAFSDVGAVCAEPSCGRQDFLPTQCFACKRFFCQDHARAELHGCVEECKEVPTMPTPSSPKATKVACAAPGCREVLVHNALRCQKCGQVVCVHHRFEDQHPCVDLEVAVKEALELARKTLRPAEFREAVVTLTKVFSNILSQPTVEKFRRLRKDNAVVKEKLKHPSCLASLHLCGFVDEADSLVCPESADLTTMRKVNAQLKAVALESGTRIVDGVLDRPKAEPGQGYAAPSRSEANPAAGQARPKSAFEFQRRVDMQQVHAEDLQALRRQQKERYRAGPKPEEATAGAPARESNQETCLIQ